MPAAPDPVPPPSPPAPARPESPREPWGVSVASANAFDDPWSAGEPVRAPSPPATSVLPDKLASLSIKPAEEGFAAETSDGKNVWDGGARFGGEREEDSRGEEDRGEDQQEDQGEQEEEEDQGATGGAAGGPREQPEERAPPPPPAAAPGAEPAGGASRLSRLGSTLTSWRRKDTAPAPEPEPQGWSKVTPPQPSTGAKLASWLTKRSDTASALSSPPRTPGAVHGATHSLPSSPPKPAGGSAALNSDDLSWLATASSRPHPPPSSAVPPPGSDMPPAWFSRDTSTEVTLDREAGFQDADVGTYFDSPRSASSVGAAQRHDAPPQSSGASLHFNAPPLEDPGLFSGSDSEEPHRAHQAPRSRPAFPPPPPAGPKGLRLTSAAPSRSSSTSSQTRPAKVLMPPPPPPRSVAQGSSMQRISSGHSGRGSPAAGRQSSSSPVLSPPAPAPARPQMGMPRPPPMPSQPLAPAPAQPQRRPQGQGGSTSLTNADLSFFESL